MPMMLRLTVAPDELGPLDAVADSLLNSADETEQSPAAAGFEQVRHCGAVFPA
jgi:hypothetical protein